MININGFFHLYSALHPYNRHSLSLSLCLKLWLAWHQQHPLPKLTQWRAEGRVPKCPHTEGIPSKDAVLSLSALCKCWSLKWGRGWRSFADSTQSCHQGANISEEIWVYQFHVSFKPYFSHLCILAYFLPLLFPSSSKKCLSLNSTGSLHNPHNTTFLIAKRCILAVCLILCPCLAWSQQL